MATEYKLEHLSRAQLKQLKDCAKIGICDLKLTVTWKDNPSDILAGVKPEAQAKQAAK